MRLRSQSANSASPHWPDAIPRTAAPDHLTPHSMRRTYTSLLTRMQKVVGSTPLQQWVLRERFPNFHAGDHRVPRRPAPRTKKPRDLQGFFKRLMGLEPTTFCMAIVCELRINAR